MNGILKLIGVSSAREQITPFFNEDNSLFQRLSSTLKQEKI